MAHQEEPMDIDSDFDNKENSLQYNNVLFTEKGYEEVDVSDLNMKLRYSVTPAASPMSRSFTATDHRPEDTENVNITRSLYSALNKTELKPKLPLQTLSSDGNTLWPHDSAGQNITITVDDDLSSPSSSSSAVPTPATTPTKEPPKSDGGSPIMRGLKSVLNMFRSSQSPIPPEESVKSDILSPEVSDKSEAQLVLASTPIAHRKEPSPSKLISPKEHRESLTFNEDLEKELQWKDETTILFSQERIPIHKLFLQQPNEKSDKIPKEDFNTTVEFMDISQNESIRDLTMTEAYMDVNTTLGTAVESDGEFVDCETTFTKTDLDEKDKTPVNKTQGLENSNSGSRLKQIILNTTQDILDATLSITPEDLLPEVSNSESVNTVVEEIAKSILSKTVDRTETVCIENIVNDLEEQIKNVTEDITNNPVNKDTINSVTSIETTETLINGHPKNEQTIDLNVTVENTVTNEAKFDQINDLNHSTESSTLNNTETIQVEPEIQQLETEVVDNVKDSITQVNQTKDITETSLDEVDKGLNSTVEISATHPTIDQTKTGETEQSTNEIIPNQPSLDESNDVNTTPIILEEKTIQPILDQTVNINATSDTVEEIAIQPILDHTFENSATPIDVEERAIKPILDQTVNINALPDIVEENAIQPIFGQTMEISATPDIVEEKAIQPILDHTNNMNATPDIEEEIPIQPIFDQTIDISTTPIMEQRAVADSTITIADTTIEIQKDVVDLPTESTNTLQVVVPNIQELNSTITKETYQDLNTVEATDENKELISCNKTESSVCNNDRTMSLNTDSSTITIADTTIEIQKDVVDLPTESTNTLQVVVPNIQELNSTITKETYQDLNTVEATDENKELISCNKTKSSVCNNDRTMSLNTDSNLVMSDPLELESRPLNPDQEEVTELPADVPLPDDDNLEDLSLPPILVNDLKPELNGSGTNCIQQTEMIIQMDDGDKIVSSAVLPVNHTMITDGAGDNINHQIENAEQILPELDSSKELTTDDTNASDNTKLSNVVNETFAKHETVETDPNIDSLTINVTASDCYMQPVPDIVNVTSDLNTQLIINTTVDIINNDPVELLEHTQSEIMTEIDNALNINNMENIDDIQDAVVHTMTDLVQEKAFVPDKNDYCGMDLDQSMSDNLLSKTDIIKEGDTQRETTIVNNTPEKFNATIEIKPQDEEITVSENNSPFVAVPADAVELDIGKENNTPKSRVLNTPPASPPISSKGYNFNFDEMDDPFATKTKIKLSPSSENINTMCKPLDNRVKTKKEINNRRKSQPARKPVATRKKFNSTFDSTVSDEKLVKTPENKDLETKTSTASLALEPNTVKNEETIPETAVELNKHTISDQNEEEPIKELEIEMHQSDEPNDLKKEIKSPSSSEQSAYYSAGASSVESNIPKNVFNLPEIDDRNFNPFATKSKVRLSPPPSINIENPFETKSKMNSSFESIEKDYDKVETEAMEKEVIANLSNNTTSSKATDENHTVREINTEDEDTIEGPFFEADDVIDDRLSDCDSESNMMQFKKPFRKAIDDQADSGELFIDAEAFEFLLNQNKCNTVVDSGKESLFLKFDPLFAKRMSAVTSDGVVAALSKVHKRERTPTKLAASPKQHTSSPIPGPSNLNVTQDLDLNSTEEFKDELNITVSKPMMVVPPAVNPVTPRNKSLTPNRSSRRSITFTSPAMAVIDRLLSLSGNTSLVHDNTVTQPSREHNEADIVLSQLRDLLAEKEISVYNLRSESRELQDRLCSMESQVKTLETECQGRLKNINDLNSRLAEKTKINKSMAAVVEEYERTIASLISETAQDKKRHAEERMKLISERDEQTAHLASMEVSFSDLHSKYEKSKQVILNCKANEDVYKKSIKEFEENLTKMQTNYELLKQHATSKLNHANQELEKINKSHEAEVLKLNAMIKRKELHITSLEETLAQKTKANEELTAICDELINKVG